MSEKVKEEFLSILKKGKSSKIIPFLKKLESKEKKSLIPVLRKENKRISEYKQSGSTWKPVGTAEEREIVSYSALFCGNEKEFRSITGGWIAQTVVKETLKHYVPSWFGKFINEQSEKQDWVPFQMDYSWMMDLKMEGILDPSEGIVVRLLPQAIFETKGKHPNMYTERNDDILFKYPETLESHIWMFFTNESQINWAGRYLPAKEEDHLNWIAVINDLVNKNKLDRKRILKATIETANMNFNKTLSGWFYELLLKLELTDQEVLLFQDELLGALNSVHSKPVNVILKLIKKNANNSKFKLEQFIEYCPILLNSDIKTTVNQTLMTLDKLGSNFKKFQEEIALVAAQALSNSDSKVQVRASKLIQKFGSNDQRLIDEISVYKSDLFSEARSILAEYLTTEKLVEKGQNIVNSEIKVFSDELTLENQIKYPDTKDDLLFFLSQAFDHNSEHDIDVLPHSLVQLASEFDGDYLDRLEPAFKRALILMTGEWRSGLGTLDRMMAAYFIEFCLHMKTVFPNYGLKMEKMYRSELKKQDDYILKWPKSSIWLFSFSRWEEVLPSQIYSVFYQKLNTSLSMIKSKIKLPLLSTPTHYPSYIDPSVLVDRLLQWKEQKETIINDDFELALARLYLAEVDSSSLNGFSELHEETQELLKFILSKSSRPKGPFLNESFWWTAAITKSPYEDYDELNEFIYSAESKSKFNGQFSWKVGVQEYMADNYDYNTGKWVKKPATKKMLKVLFKQSPQQNLKSSKKTLKDFFKKAKAKVLPVHNFYKDIKINTSFYTHIDFDVKRLLLLTPNMPEKTLSFMTMLFVSDQEFWGEDKKRSFIQCLQQVHELDYSMGEMGHLILARGMISQDKTGRLLSAEVWSKKSSLNLISNSKLGKILGKHLSVEFSPFKRFTDLIQESMIKFSASQDIELKILIENLLVELKPQNYRGLKKLLEYYNELILSTSTSFSKELSLNLQAWQKEKSTKSICSSILKK